MVAEAGIPSGERGINELRRLGFGKCKLCLLTNRERVIDGAKPTDFVGKRIGKKFLTILLETPIFSFTPVLQTCKIAHSLTN